MKKIGDFAKEALKRGLLFLVLPPLAAVIGLAVGLAVLLNGAELTFEMIEDGLTIG